MCQVLAMATVVTCGILEIEPTVVRVALIVAGILSAGAMCRRAVMLVVVSIVFLKCAPRVMVPCMLPAATIMLFMVVLVFSLHHLESTGSHSCTQAGFDEMTTLVLMAVR